MNNLKKAREARGLSQKEAALSLKVSVPTVSEWESGKKNPTISNLLQLANLYGVSTDYLLGEASVSIRQEGTSAILRTNNPVSILIAQYQLAPSALAKLLGEPLSVVERWLAGAKPDQDNKKALAEFFEVSPEDLENGKLSLYPNPEVQKKIRYADTSRFAAHEKNGDFSDEDMESIEQFKAFLRAKRLSADQEGRNQKKE